MKRIVIGTVAALILTVGVASADIARPSSGQCNIYPTAYKVDGKHRLVATFKVQCDTSKIAEVLVEGRFDMQDEDGTVSEKFGIHREYPAAWSRTVTFRRQCATTPRKIAFKQRVWSGQYNVVVTGFNGQRAVGEGGEYIPKKIACYMKKAVYSPPPSV